MPQGDGTGPVGAGPLTGRGLGPCGRGFRLGFGRGYGWRAGAETLNLTKAQEKKILEAELVELEAEKSEIEKRIKEMKS